MTGSRRTALTLTALASLVLTSCTSGTAEPDETSTTVEAPAASEPPLVEVLTTSPADALTVITGTTEAETALAASQHLFGSAPVAFVAPAGDPAAQEIAARAAISLGVPLLIGAPSTVDGAGGTGDTAPSGEATDETTHEATDEATGAPSGAATDAPADPAADALAAELERLAVTNVVVVGDVAPLVGEGDDSTGRTTVRSDATADALSALTGTTFEAAPADPATFTSAIAAYVPAGASSADDPAATPAPGATPSPDPTPSPTATPSDGDATSTDDSRLPEVTSAAPLTDVVALAVDGPEQIAPVATARAAGVPVLPVPAANPNPQAHGSVIEALHASAAPKTMAIGAGLADQSALDWKVRSARGGSQLPGGGQLMFPTHQFVAIYGSPITGALGVLGEQPAPQAVQRARDVAAPYQGLSDKTVVPMFEIIATVAAAQAGDDGNYSNEQPVDTLRPWVDEAAAAGMYVVIDLQPGRTDFLTQAKLYEELLMLPNVGLALDPEWRLTPDQVPLGQIGSVSAAEVNEVVQWLADLTNAHSLPPKMLVLHQFQLRMLADRASITTDRPELAVVIHADGQGGQGAKQSTWNTLHEGAPAGVAWGWKNFYDEDLPMLTPQETVHGVAPIPDLVTYQ